MGKSLTLIGYSSGLSEIAKLDELYWSYDLPHNNWLTPDTVLSFGGSYMILQEWRQMVLFFVDMC